MNRLFCFCVAMMATGAVAIPRDTIDFFPNIRDNLTRVTWAHAVNSAKFLDEVLNSDTMMIEADIVMGTLVNDPQAPPQPVMGHPPATTSDISLKRFLETINESNQNATRSVKGVKLDFKSIEVFEASLATVAGLYQQVDYPVWINADIIPGPIEAQGTPVDADRFLSANAAFPAVMLSTGWTTRYSLLVRNGTYTEDQIDEMLSAIRRNGAAQKITYPIRAGIGANSERQIERLLAESPVGTTLTVWSSSGDPVNVDNLRRLMLSVGLDRVYLDVPKELSDQLNLG